MIVDDVLVQEKRTYLLDRIQGRLFQVGGTMLKSELSLRCKVGIRRKVYPRAPRQKRLDVDEE